MFKEKRYKIVMYFIVAIWIAAQLFIIKFFWGIPQHSDPSAYQALALKCFNNGEWYPMLDDVYSLYIFAPGFINYLILQLNLFGTTNFNMIFNLMMNICILFEVYYLGKLFFSKKTAIFSVILFCLLYSNLTVVLPTGTEIPFLFLSLSGFCLSISKNKILILVGGILFALANTIRPLVLVFILATLVYLFLRKDNIKSYLALLLPVLIITFIIGLSTYNKIGYFVFQSTTSARNLIMTANDKAYGGVATHLFYDKTTTCYIDESKHYTFVQQDSILKARAIKWIKENPSKFLGLYFKKMVGLYIEDSWPDRPIFGGNGFIGKYATGYSSSKDFLLFAAKIVLKSLTYYIVFILFLFSLYLNIKGKNFTKDKAVILSIIIIGTLITCIYPVSSRYHYPFIFVIILFAANTFDFYEKRLKNY